MHEKEVEITTGGRLYANEFDPDDDEEGLHMMQVYRMEEGRVFATNSWGGRLWELKVPEDAVMSMWKVLSSNVSLK